MVLRALTLLLLFVTAAGAQTLGRLPGVVYLSDYGARDQTAIKEATMAVAGKPTAWVFDGHWRIAGRVDFTAADTVYALPGTVFELSAGAVVMFHGAEFIAHQGVTFTGAGITDGTARYPHRFAGWGDPVQYNLAAGYLDYGVLTASNFVNTLAFTNVPTGTLASVVAYLTTNSVIGFGVYTSVSAYVSNVILQIQATNAAFTSVVYSVTTNINKVAESSAAAAAAPVGSIISFCGVPPAGWAECDGALLSTVTYSALFQCIGYTYGGSGGSFAVPDMRGRLSVMAGSSTNMDAVGETGGEAAHVLTIAEMPSHTHIIYIYADHAEGNTPNTGTQGQTGAGDTSFDVNTGSISYRGSSAGHNNYQPYMVVRKAIKY